MSNPSRKKRSHAQRARRRGGAVLIMVALAIATVAAVAFLVFREATLQLHLGSAAAEEEEALHVADAGVAHGVWYAENVACGPVAALTGLPLGPHQYDIQFTPVLGGETRVTSTATLASGVQRERSAQVQILTGDTPTLVLPAVADVYVHTDGHNDGQRLDLHVKRSLVTAKIENALLGFEFPEVSRWVLTGASLDASLFGWNHGNDGLPSGGPVTIAARGVVQDWLEGGGENPCPCSGAIWSSPDGDLANNWLTPGGTFLPNFYDPQPVENIGRYSWDVSPLVASWLDGTRANQGIGLTAVFDKPDQAKFRSREYVYDPGEPGEAPSLQVHLACPCGTLCRTTYRDEFTQRTCSAGDADWRGSDGVISADWSANAWLRSHPGADSCNGDIKIGTLGGDRFLQVGGDGKSIERGVNLSAHTRARLSFDYFRFDLGSSQYVDVEVSGNGGATWTLLRRIFGSGSDPAEKHSEFDISAFMSANTRIRFSSTGLSGSSSVLFDDVQIDEAAASPAPPPPVTIPSVADAWIAENNDDDNYGGGNNLSLREDPSLERRAVLRFGVSAIPPGTLVDTALLRLWVNRNESAAPGANLLVSRLMQGWTEDDVTWTDRNGSFAWSTSGGSVQSPPVNQRFIADTFKDDWIEIDITPLVQGWVDGVTANHGVRVDTDQTEVIRVSAREHSAAEAPQLYVTFQ